MSDPIDLRAELGYGLEPGADHYRAYVGPPRDYDLVAAMTFGLLTSLGLRQHHRVLDIGCGSLRVGRLLIPYLLPGCYVGIEPNRWLVDEGIRRETGADQIAVKRARFVFSDSPGSLPGEERFDFALAQSIFSHTGRDLLEAWLAAASAHLEESGALVATFLEGESDHSGTGWVYPSCVAYRRSTLDALARQHDLGFRVLDWRHPRQSWALFARPGFAMRWLDERSLGWNASIASGHWD